MGFTPQQVDQMSMWQYLAAVEGYVKANSVDDANGLSSREADELWEWMKNKER